MLWESKKVRKDFLEEVVYQFWREERIGIDLTEGEMGEACYPQREDPLVESLQDCEEQLSVVYKPSSPWDFVMY